MSMQVFFVMLMAVSLLTSLVVEGIKKMLKPGETFTCSNIVVGIVALVLALAVSIGYALYIGIAFTTQYIIAIVALCLLSWLCAMVGYDKVIQTLEQIAYHK